MQQYLKKFPSIRIFVDPAKLRFYAPRHLEKQCHRQPAQQTSLHSNIWSLKYNATNEDHWDPNFKEELSIDGLSYHEALVIESYLMEKTEYRRGGVYMHESYHLIPDEEADGRPEYPDVMFKVDPAESARVRPLLDDVYSMHRRADKKTVFYRETVGPNPGDETLSVCLEHDNGVSCRQIKVRGASPGYMYIVKEMIVGGSLWRNDGYQDRPVADLS